MIIEGILKTKGSTMKMDKKIIKTIKTTTKTKTITQETKKKLEIIAETTLILTTSILKIIKKTKKILIIPLLRIFNKSNRQIVAVFHKNLKKASSLFTKKPAI